MVGREPRRPRGELVRHLFVSDDISQILDGGETETQFADAIADAEIAQFLAGYYVTVSRQQRKWTKGSEPRLVKIVGYDDVWEMCFRRPPPGWRLFGRFLHRDIFVGLRFHDKISLGSDYESVCHDVIDDWEGLFPGVDPVRSENLDDYLSSTWDDDEE